MKGTTNFITKNMQKIVKSEAFKYVFIVLAFLNILAYVTTNAMLCLVTFIIAYGAADNWVGDNLGINLFVALFVSNVVFSCGRVQEAFSSCNKREHFYAKKKPIKQRATNVDPKKVLSSKEGLDNIMKQLNASLKN